eukprot:1488745-Alexandrium_andersonii.AAC.1
MDSTRTSMKNVGEQSCMRSVACPRFNPRSEARGACADIRSGHTTARRKRAQWPQTSLTVLPTQTSSGHTRFALTALRKLSATS